LQCRSNGPYLYEFVTVLVTSLKLPNAAVDNLFLEEAFCLGFVSYHYRRITMSAAMLTTVSINMYLFSGSPPVTPGTDSTATRTQPARQVDQQDGDRGRFRENTLVSAIMAAFQALGIGRPAASAPTGSTASGAPDTATTPAVSAATAAPMAAADSTPATDTLEKAVNEFAHTLSGLLHHPDRGAASANEAGVPQGHHHEGHGKAGYRGLAQRLEQLAQSLGAASAPTSTSTDAVTTTQVSTLGTPTPSTGSVSPAPSSATSRLLAAFAKVLSFLQPTSTTPPPEAGTSSGTDVNNASTADKLKQFLTTLSQSLHSGGPATPLSPVGSRVNLTA
jgi:hypothetical protein